jgi:glycine/D-amino acid oxidase-like deaminating enzyme
VRRLFCLPENIALSNYSIPFYENFPETMATGNGPAEIGFKKQGYIFIVPPAEIDVLKANYDTELSLGCNVVWLEPDEIKARFPSMYVGDLGAAVLSPDDGWLDPYAVLMGLRKKAQALGAVFLAETVTGLERRAATVTAALTDKGALFRMRGRDRGAALSQRPRTACLPAGGQGLLRGRADARGTARL